MNIEMNFKHEKIRQGKVEYQSNTVSFRVSKLSREEKRIHSRTNNKYTGASAHSFQCYGC